MTAPILHYLYDPLCGWCYGAAPLVKAAREVLQVHAHGGGMMAGRRRQAVTPQLRDYVTPHDRRIEQLTGQPFGPAYLNGLLYDSSAVFDSEPPIAAVLAAEQLAGRGLDMLASLQVGHYVEGQRIAKRDVLIERAGAIGLDPADFFRVLEEVEGEAVQAHISDTHRLMTHLGVRGFPSLALEQGGRMTAINASVFIGRPQALQDLLRAHVPQTASTDAVPSFGCGPDSCVIKE